MDHYWARNAMILKPKRILLLYIVPITIFISCKENEVEPDPEPFALIYEVVNSSNSEILADISALAYFPKEDVTNSIFKNFHELERGDTGVYVADHILAYEGCERVLTVNCYQYINSLTSYIHWTFDSEIDTLTNSSDQLLRFTWPIHSATYHLVSLDTIPWN